jgi:hypothetical protein
LGNLGSGSFTRDFETVKKRYVNGASLYETSAKEGSFTGKCASYVRHVKEGLEREHHSSYIGSVRGTWMEGSYTKDSERHVMESSGIETFLL